MSTHFSANQYENAFDSKKLGNWENPQRYIERPKTQNGYTRIIASDKGHIVPPARRSQENPWGNFVGTWDIPKHIPGNCARVTTARTSSAQQKLQAEAEEANRVLSGKTKNEIRAAGSGQGGLGGYVMAAGDSPRISPAPRAPSAALVPAAPSPAAENLPVEIADPAIPMDGACSPTTPTKDGPQPNTVPDM